MAQNYYQKEIETMSREDMKKLQSEKLVKQVKHVYENVEYYRNLMDEKGVTPDDIKSVDDLHKLPFLSKADLRDAYPYGLLGKPLSECVRIHSTSGTTGKSKTIKLTNKAINENVNKLGYIDHIEHPGEECEIIFSGKYGFGNDVFGIIPANSALLYKIWVVGVAND
mgnify:CR=1 FL=1